MEKQSGVIKVQGLPVVVARFNWSVGVKMEKFIKALADKKILAAKCPECGYTYAPPRSRCSKCHAKIEDSDIIELSGKGTLMGYTLAQVELDGKGAFLDLDKPKIIGAVKLDGADSTIFMPLEEVDPEKIKTPMKVDLQWAQETKGDLKDLKYFKPDK